MVRPDLDSPAFLEKLARDPITARILFVFQAACWDKRDVREGLDWGAEEDVLKPGDKTALRSTICAGLGAP